jgi:transducin (beta)-like 1
MDDGRGAEATSPSSISPANSENAPILLQCEWSPKDPSILAAVGTDALARVWTVPRATAPEPGQDHVSPPVHSLVDPDAPRNTTATALAWTSDGASIAVATDADSHANINIWSADGNLLKGLEVAEPPVIRLAWNPSNTKLLSISPDKGGALVTVYSTGDGSSIAYSLTGHDIHAAPLDAAWINDTDFLLCGGDMLVCLRCAESSVSQVRKFETKDDESFTQVLFDWRSKLAATSSDRGTLDVSMICRYWTRPLADIRNLAMG